MKTLADMLDRALELGFRISGHVLAIACGVIGVALLLVNPVLALILFACAVANAIFALRVVCDIRDSSDRYPFLARTVLVPAKIAVLVGCICALMDLGHTSDLTPLIGLRASCQLMCAVFASRVVWQLERRWFPGRITHPLFGRWLEWKGARS